MSQSVSRMVGGLIGFAGVCALGSLGYVVAGWSPLDAFYMVIITIFGVGYGEVNPVETPALRVFTIAVIVAGYAAAALAVGGFLQLVTEGEIHRALGARRMATGIDKLRDHVIICGYGRLGRILASDLRATGAAVVVVDNDEERIREAHEQGLDAIEGDATDERLLAKAGVERASALAAVLSDDARNVFVTLTASDLAPDLRILARAENPSSRSKLLRSGASEVVMPAATGAHHLSNLILQPDVAQLVGRSDGGGALDHELNQIGLRLEEFSVPDGSPLVGSALSDIEIGGNHGFLIVAIRKADGEVNVRPPDETRLDASDTVIVVGHDGDLPQLKARYELRRERSYRGVRYAG